MHPFSLDACDQCIVSIPSFTASIGCTGHARHRIEEASEFYGVSLKTELGFAWVILQAMVAPLPPYWQELHDGDGDVYYYNPCDDHRSYDHPADLYFCTLLKQVRIAW
jgi:hypothetical protein